MHTLCTQVMSEILAGIRVIKLYAWEKNFVRKILFYRYQALICYTYVYTTQHATHHATQHATQHAMQHAMQHATQHATQHTTQHATFLCCCYHKPCIIPGVPVRGHVMSKPEPDQKYLYSELPLIRTPEIWPPLFQKSPRSTYAL